MDPELVSDLIYQLKKYHYEKGSSYKGSSTKNDRYGRETQWISGIDAKDVITIEIPPICESCKDIGLLYLELLNNKIATSIYRKIVMAWNSLSLYRDFVPLMLLTVKVNILVTGLKMKERKHFLKIIQCRYYLSCITLVDSDKCHYCSRVQ